MTFGKLLSLASLVAAVAYLGFLFVTATIGEKPAAAPVAGQGPVAAPGDDTGLDGGVTDKPVRRMGDLVAGGPGASGSASDLPPQDPTAQDYLYCAGVLSASLPAGAPMPVAAELLLSVGRRRIISDGMEAGQVGLAVDSAVRLGRADAMALSTRLSETACRSLSDTLDAG